jgi:ATP-dependent DNA helicase RecQ
MTELSTTQATIQDAQALLSTTYGYDHFRGPQQAVIESALAGQDSVVLMPTGGGKSLCYQIPALLREGMGIIVSPLIALMQDQVSALQQLGIRANYLNSTQSTGEQQQIIEEIRFGTLDLLYVAPERLLQARTLQLLSQCKISVIAIDEAHCVSQWGHDFRQDYMGLYQLREQFPNVPRMALTATADPRTQVEITHNLQLNNAERFISDFDRPNIRYTVQPKTDAKKQLIKFLLVHREHAGIVYCMSRKKVESTAQWLCGRGLTALPYHAGLSTQIRATNLQRFLREDHIIMVATIAFGMGIDKPDVRFVAHLDLPKSLEAYYQETGRAGRDGEPSDAWMTYGLQDVVRLRQMMNQSTASEQQKRIEQGKLDALLGWSETTECRRRPLLNYFGENSTDDCGNCDNCLTPPELWDATEAAQKILSCIYRTGQRFGAVHVIDVLRGRENDKTAQWGHRELSTFGIGKEITEQQWRSILRQLIVQGYLISDAERYGALRLTETSRPLLRGEVNLLLRKDIAEAGSEKALRKKVQNKSKYGVTDGDRTLWDKLRVCRKQLADEHAVPPYVIFHDATLMEMMEYRPTTDAELLNISGVGDTKLERYGAAFLEVLNSASE